MEESLGLPRLNCGRGGIKASVTICCVVCVERNVDCCGENAFLCVFSPLCVLWHSTKEKNHNINCGLCGVSTRICAIMLAHPFYFPCTLDINTPTLY